MFFKILLSMLKILFSGFQHKPQKGFKVLPRLLPLNQYAARPMKVQITEVFQLRHLMKTIELHSYQMRQLGHVLAQSAADGTGESQPIF